MPRDNLFAAGAEAASRQGPERNVDFGPRGASRGCSQQS